MSQEALNYVYGIFVGLGIGFVVGYATKKKRG